MYSQVSHYSLLRGLESFGLALALGLLLSSPIMALIQKLGSRQTIHDYAPESHQTKAGTPTMGGLIVLAGLLPALIVSGLTLGPALYYLAIIIVAFAFIGFVDDYWVPRMPGGKRGLGWVPKLLLQFCAATLAPVALGFPFQPYLWGITIFLVLFFANAYNFADGLDGLAASIGIVLAIGFSALITLLEPDLPIAPFLALAGALIPFLFLNAPKAKVFMGDLGALPIGAMFGVMATTTLRETIFKTFAPLDYEMENHPAMLVARSAVWLPVAVISFVMIAELVPVPLQVAYYKLTKGKRLFPFTPIHHAFEKKGWQETRIVFMFTLVQLICVGLALYLLLIQVAPIPASQ